MKFILSLIVLLLIFINLLHAQSNKGIHFQAIARNENGLIIPTKQITLRISILTDSIQGMIIYQEIKSVTTNMLGLLFIDIGNEEPGKVVTIGSFNEINWSSKSFYLQVELDPNNALSFLNAGIEKINYVPLALYADKSNMVESIVPIELGGTGVGSIKEIVKLLNMEKVNNTPDSLKPISNAMNSALNEKLKKSDTLYLSNRINAIPKIDTLIINNKLNQKLNTIDTIKLSNRINLKLNMSDTVSLSNRINNKINIGSLSSNDIMSGLGYAPVKNNFGIFYDSSKQITNIATATAIKFNFYPCEIADKYQGDIEIRDLKEPNGVLFNEDLLEFKAQLNKQLHKHDSYVSSLDLLTEAVLEGKEKSKNKNSYLGLSIGGQVGPGDPSRAETPGSPRKSISRELARGMLSQNKIKKNETLKLIEKADKLFFQQRKQNDACPVVWVENKFSFFEFDENYDETPDSNDNVYTCASKN